MEHYLFRGLYNHGEPSFMAETWQWIVKAIKRAKDYIYTS